MIAGIRDNPGMSVSLPQIAASSTGSPYRCPGEDSGVSQALHLARLDAGWEGCRRCAWNPSTESAHTNFNRDIRLTASGLRAAYRNVLDRPLMERLSGIYAAELRRQNVASDRHVLLGFDDTYGAPDLAAGVARGFLRAGWNVVDIGRTSTARILFEATRNTGSGAAIIVTGSGARTGEIGIDAFKIDGHRLSVSWRDHGVEVSHFHDDSSSSHSPVIRFDNELPAQTGRGRTSGRLVSQACCSTYEQRLRSCWNRVDRPTTLLIPQPYLQEEFARLLDDVGVRCVDVRASDDDAADFVIHEDDRFFSAPGLQSKAASRGAASRGVALNGVALNVIADTINAGTTGFAGMTAHVSRAGDRILLVDAAGPDHAASHEVFSDGLMTIGLYLSSLANRTERRHG